MRLKQISEEVLYGDDRIVKVVWQDIEFLKDKAITTLGLKYFRKKPLSFHSQSELLKVLLKKRKLKVRIGEKEIDWRRIVKVRNAAIHVVRKIDGVTARWYLDEIQMLIRENT